jgi:hypothetical protein
MNLGTGHDVASASTVDEAASLCPEIHRGPREGESAEAERDRIKERDPSARSNPRTDDSGEAEMGDTFVGVDVAKADFVVACGPGSNEGRTA